MTRVQVGQERVPLQARAGKLSVLPNVQTGSVIHPAFWLMDSAGYLPSGKAVRT